MKNLTRPLEMIWATIPAGSFIMGSSKKQVDQIKQLDPGYSDEWLNRKKGKAFMPLVERIEILKAIKYIDYVWTFDDEDNTACKLIEKVIQKFSNRAGEFKIYFGNLPIMSFLFEYYLLWN